MLEMILKSSTGRIFKGDLVDQMCNSRRIEADK